MRAEAREPQTLNFSSPTALVQKAHSPNQFVPLQWVDKLRVWGPCTALEHCPRPRAVITDERGEVLQAWPCRKPSCVTCNRDRIRAVTAALELTRPDVLITLTAFTGNREDDRLRMQKFARAMRSTNDRFEAQYSWESHPGLTNVHAHLWAHGDRLSDARVARASACAGLGRSDVRAVTTSAGFGYGLKMTIYSETTLEGFRSLNGGRMTNASQGFWRDHRSGDRMTRVEATVAARRAGRATRASWYTERLS